MDRVSATAIVAWRYDPPYDFYNWSSDADDEIAAMLDPVNHVVTIREADLGLVAFCSFGADGQVPGGDYSAEALDLGLGMRPDLTGRGLGNAFVAAVIAEAEVHEMPKRLRVTIAEFNHRARHVWERAGFRFVQRFLAEESAIPFIILTRDEMS